MNKIDFPKHYRLDYHRNDNIVAEEYKVIYYNTQKNANSTMKAQFVEVLGMPKTERFPKDVHYTYLYNFPSASQNEIITKYQDYLKFSIIRNPWERLVSCYKNKLEGNNKKRETHILECHPDLHFGMSFEKFVAVVCAIPDSEADYHFCSQIFLMMYPDGTFPINYLCNIEKLGFHIEEIKSRTGIPFNPLAQLNSSGKSSYEKYYTSELIEKVNRRYQADIEFFKFEFGKKNETFSFGEVTAKWTASIRKHPFMLPVLQEKQHELFQIKHRKLNTLPANIKVIIENEKVLRWKLENIKNSISWQITSPLRKIFDLFMRK